MIIWTLGDAVVDLLPIENMQYEACAGGAPFNVAAGVAILGQQSGFIGRVGNDTFGHFLQQTLVTAGVNTKHIEFDDRRHTSTVLVSLDKHGERHFDFLVNPSADQFLSPDALPDFHSSILHFCSLALVSPVCRNTLSKAIEHIHAAQGILSFDLNVRKQMWNDGDEMFSEIHRFAQSADILKMSEEEWYWLTQSHDFATARQRLERFSARLKIVTCGSRGAMIFWQNQLLCFTGYQVNSVDTTGAGDAFMAGLLAALADHGWPTTHQEISTLVELASGCGALATTQKGALKTMPCKDTLTSFIHTQMPLQVEVLAR
ncbi:fructokinase [Chania multitudinisentens RB-25]|uniref:Fructokinase n=1 Tax=Chania multitudinisentens RB-25 TaxID=1441930 RepID=W0L449_9GAMM|nr:aminoimidazole riboside kinase [Chania multitudinisentens]AHG18538.1 fructokinase [Chania multitudinisentens RB-25]